MSELRHDPYGPYRSWGAEPAEPAAEVPALRVVPDLPLPLGHGLLGEEDALDQELVLRRRVQVTHDVVTLVLEPTRPGLFTFRPGQFLTLGVEVDGVAMERCYTISSPPSRPHLLTVTVKRMPGGPVSAHLHDGLAVGDRVTARGPHGDFTVSAHPASRYLLLSAGSGVTPTLATLRALADLGELGDPGPDGLGGTDVVVVHAARTPADLVCRAEVEALVAAHDGLRVTWVCEDDEPGRPGAWTGPRGRVDADLLRAAVPDLHEREVLTCGPPGFMGAVRGVLASLGVDPARCHEESFVIGDSAAPVAVATLDPTATTAGGAAFAALHETPVVEAAPGVTVRFGRSDREVVCGPGTTVLEAATEAGVFIPSSCSAGMCGTCKIGLLGGRVEMNHQGGIRPREIAQDKFLPCCSTPDGDIVVDA